MTALETLDARGSFAFAVGCYSDSQNSSGFGVSRAAPASAGFYPSTTYDHFLEPLDWFGGRR